MISEQEELASQITQNNLQGLRFVSTIQLIKVIGGGWECNSKVEGLEECN